MLYIVKFFCSDCSVKVRKSGLSIFASQRFCRRCIGDEVGPEVVQDRLSCETDAVMERVKTLPLPNFEAIRGGQDSSAVKNQQVREATNEEAMEEEKLEAALQGREEESKDPGVAPENLNVFKGVMKFILERPKVPTGAAVSL